MGVEEMTERIPSEVVADLVSMAWQTFVGSDLELVAGSPVDDAPLMSSSIAIGGPWSGTGVLHLARSLAYAATSATLGMELDELVDADVRDIVGELANIIGGNVKGFVSDADGDWSLSLPVVSDGMQTVPGSRLVTEVHFRCEGGVVGCQVREHG